MHTTTRRTDTDLSPADLDVFRGLLEEQRGFRTEQLAALAQPGPPGRLGSADGEIVASLTTGARAALRDVQNALWRMDAGSYGRCARCASPLGLARLEILPQVALCMPCQRDADPAAV